MELTNFGDWEAALSRSVAVSENRVFALLSANLELVRSLEQHFKQRLELIASQPPSSNFLGLSTLMAALSLPSSPPNARFLYELDVHLELLKTHLAQLREKLFMQNYEYMALGGFWSLLKVSQWISEDALSQSFGWTFLI